MNSQKFTIHTLYDCAATMIKKVVKKAVTSVYGSRSKDCKS